MHIPVTGIQDWMSSPETAVTDELPLKVPLDNTRLHQCPWMIVPWIS